MDQNPLQARLLSPVGLSVVGFVDLIGVGIGDVFLGCVVVVVVGLGGAGLPPVWLARGL